MLKNEYFQYIENKEIYINTHESYTNFYDIYQLALGVIQQPHGHDFALF